MNRPDTFAAQQLRSAFADGDLATASPAVVLVRCFDRLDADFDTAIDAIELGHIEIANRSLGHAQDLVGELATMLDLDAWEHAASLLSIYDYVLRLLAAANMKKDAGPVVECKRLLSEIGTAFRTAAATPTAGAPAPADAPVAPEVAATPSPAATAGRGAGFVVDRPQDGFSVLA